jgi:hypothetical protein
MLREVKSTRKQRGKFRRKFTRVSVPHKNSIQNLDNKRSITSMLRVRKPKYQCQASRGKKLTMSELSFNIHLASLITAFHKRWGYQMDSKNCYKIIETGLTKPKLYTLCSHMMQ